jgi:hypothetical protein
MSCFIQKSVQSAILWIQDYEQNQITSLISLDIACDCFYTYEEYVTSNELIISSMTGKKVEYLVLSAEYKMV